MKPDLKMDKVLLIVLLVISFFSFFYRLGAPSLFETDEVIYSQVAREIVRSGDWITLHLFSKNWFIHPPFYMWLTAASSFVFGDGEFNTRLWNALFAIGLVFVTYLLGKKMFRDGVGLLAGFILACTLQYILQARFAIFDIPLVFFMMLSVLFFFHWLEDKESKYYYFMFLSMGLATLMKGPVGILLPLLVIFPFLAATRSLRALFNYRIVPGLMIAVVVGGAWYAAETMIHGQQFVDSVFGFYLIGRYLTSIERHYGPWYFYIPVMIVGFIPWTAFLPYSFYYQWRRRGDTDNLFAIFWMAIVFLFFTLAGTKLPGYIMSLYPIAAISVAKMVQDHLSGEDSGLDLLISRSYKTLAVFSAVILVIAALLRIFEFPDSLSSLIANLNMTLLIVGSGGIISSIVFFRQKRSIAPIAVLIATMIVFSSYTANRTMITLDDFKPMKAISQKINSQFLSREVIMGYNVLNKGSFQHYLDKPVIWINDIFDLRDQIKRNERFYLITNENDFIGFGADTNKTLFILFKEGDMVLLSNKRQ